MIDLDALRIEKANERRIREIFGWMGKQFAQGEIKPLEMILRMVHDGYYDVYALVNGEELTAYALMVRAKEKDVCLLDYFAVLPHLQDQGIGGFFLKALQKSCECACILIEAEDPDTNEGERSHRERRLRFYQRNGCVLSSAKTTVFGFDYVILALSAYGKSDCDAASAMADIYHRMLPEDVYRKNIVFREL